MFPITSTGTVAPSPAIARSTPGAPPGSAIAGQLGEVRNVAEGWQRVRGDMQSTMASSVLAQRFSRDVISSFQMELDAASNLESASRMHSDLADEANRIFIEAVGQDVEVVLVRQRVEEAAVRQQRDDLVMQGLIATQAFIAPSTETAAENDVGPALRTLSDRALAASMARAGLLGDLAPNGAAASAA